MSKANMGTKDNIMEDDNISEMSFEDAIAQLENIVRELESGRIKLDDAVMAYEKAIKLKQLCESKLQNAQLKIEKLNIDTHDNVSIEELSVPEE